MGPRALASLVVTGVLAAALASQVNLDGLADAANVDDAEGALAPAVANGLVSIRGDSVVFAHPLYRSALAAAPSALRRLTALQYTNAIHDVFGADVTVPGASALEPDVFRSGYVAIDASTVTISPRGVAQYERAAYDIAHQAMDPSRRAALVPCTPVEAFDTAWFSPAPVVADRTVRAICSVVRT